jgi:hypothetical protein
MSGVALAPPTLGPELRPVSSIYAASFSAGSISAFTDSTESNESFMVPGLGMLSGKAILAIGKAEIRALGWAWAMYRRTVINGKFPHQNNHSIAKIGEMYDDLLYFAFL